MKTDTPRAVLSLVVSCALILTACSCPQDGCAGARNKDFEIVHVSLADAANMGLADERYGDGVGGWFDQGPVQDMSGMPVGKAISGFFDVVDPAANGGRSIVVLAGGERQYFPQSVKIGNVPANIGGTLLLMHSAGWMPPQGTKIGGIVVTYADGSSQTLDVVAGRDVADWFNLIDLPNGQVAWSKPLRGFPAGLYSSVFKIADKPVASIELCSERKAVWAVAALSLSSVGCVIPQQQPLVVKGGGEWRPYTSSLDVVPGSALDLSWMLDAPAGKHGYLTARDGHFYFECCPQERVRFFGTNLCYSANFPSHEDAPKIAASLAANGYNVVRFHHYDDMLTMHSADSTTPDPELRDRMEFFIAECEKRGMYIVIDLFSYRSIRKGEIPEIEGDVRAGFKALPPVLDSAMENWKTFARNIMTHVNPYTGMSLANDPALVGVCPVNEDPLGTVWRDSPSISALYDRLFAEWKSANGVAPQGAQEETAALSRFLNEVQLRGDRAYERFLRDELKVRAPLTGTNCLNAISLAQTRANYDYVDNHLYWDHPTFPVADWRLPYRYTQLSSVESSAFFPRTMFPTRIKGRPFTVTEWNTCNPNRFRAEGATLVAAYAGLQDWDGLYRFAHSHNIDNLVAESAATGFDLATDPISQMSERYAAVMFLRGDVAPAKGYVTYAVDSANAYRVISGWGQEGYEEAPELLGLVTGVGSVWAEGEGADSIDGPLTGSANFASDADYVAPDMQIFSSLEKRGVLEEGLADTKNGIFRSDTGEILLDAGKGLLGVATDRSEVFTLSKPGTAHGALASIESAKAPVTVAVVSLDGGTLADSSRILVFHLPEQSNTNASYLRSDRRLMDNWGELPHLIAAIRTNLHLAIPAQGLRAYALDSTGRRVREVPLSAEGVGVSMILDSGEGPEAALAYEIVRE
jgi:hypothetical protein